MLPHRQNPGDRAALQNLDLSDSNASAPWGRRQHKSVGAGLRPARGTHTPTSQPSCTTSPYTALLSSPSPRCLNGGDIDLLHLHHRLKGALCLCAASPESIG